MLEQVVPIMQNPGGPSCEQLSCEIFLLLEYSKPLFELLAL